MRTYVYAFGENGTPVGVLEGDVLWDPFMRSQIACTDGRGGLFNNPYAIGCPNYFLIGNQIRAGGENGPTVFTIRGKTICDGAGNIPTFHCLNDGDHDIALALTAIANVGELRFRPIGASVISGNSYPFPSSNFPDSNVDYSVVNGNSPDPWGNKQIPSDLKNRFENNSRSSSFYKNIQSSRIPPKEGINDNVEITSADSEQTSLPIPKIPLSSYGTPSQLSPYMKIVKLREAERLGKITQAELLLAEIEIMQGLTEKEILSFKREEKSQKEYITNLLVSEVKNQSNIISNFPSNIKSMFFLSTWTICPVIAACISNPGMKVWAFIITFIIGVILTELYR